jgi:hypothetical protein
MSEFVECQNCGRQFHAENLDCPYCGGEDDDPATLVTELMRTVAPATTRAVSTPAAHGGLFSIMFGLFAAFVAVVCAVALAGAVRVHATPARLMLALEAVFAMLTIAAMSSRRPWGRWVAIAFILWNTAIGVGALVERDRGGLFAWGPESSAFLLFLWPFLTRNGRERFSR